MALLTLLLTGLLVSAAVLILAPGRRSLARLRALLGPGDGKPSRASSGEHGEMSWRSAVRSRLPGGRRGTNNPGDTMTLVIQQMAALLKGGRSPARLWEELMLVHTRETIGPGSFGVLMAARGAANLGSPVSAAIRAAAAEPKSGAGAGGREQRVWFDVAACLDVAHSSGCPLADVLTRLAAQLEVEDDAEAARQTALAGPRSTVALLGWLPLTGVGLGMVLGVDPLAMLLGTPAGIAALLAGSFLTVAGRMWSARLVRSAATGSG